MTFQRVLFITAIALGLAAPAAANDAPTYERDIKPLFAKHCTACHASRKVADLNVSGGLALDSYDAVVKGTSEHKIALAGHAAESELVRRLNASDEDERMPLQDDPLPEAQRTLVARWIDAGLPRGEPIALTTSPRAAHRRIRATDVVLPLELKLAKGNAGLDLSGPVALAAKVGPLPAVTALAFRGDGRQLAVGTAGQVTVWDLHDGAPALFLREIPGGVHALAFSRDGRRLAVGAGLPGRGGVVRIYTVPDGALVHDLVGHTDVVYAVAFRRDDAQLASAGFDQTVRLWSLADGTPAGVFEGHSDFVYDVAYAPDGRTVLSASKDRTVKRFDAATGKGLRTYSDHDDDVLAVAVRPDGEFVSAGNEPQLRWWSDGKDKPVRKVGGHGGPVHQLAFSGDGSRLISASGDKSVRIWDGRTGNFLRQLPGQTEWQYAAALSHDGHIAAAGGWDGVVRVWDADKGTQRAILLHPPSPSASQNDWLAISPAGYFAAPDELAALVRWRVGVSETNAEPLKRTLWNADKLARAQRGEKVDAPFAGATK